MRRARRSLADLAAVDYSVDLATRDAWVSTPGWTIDDYAVSLPPEAPGEPAEDGPFRHAVEVVRGYEFADPAIVRGTWDADSPLAGRTMLLEARFAGLRFQIGTRIYRVIDERRRDDGGEVVVWGWGYATLAGHFELGTMDYEVQKRLDDGTVRFAIHVRSRRAPVHNPLVRIGFRLFGRRVQRRFARRACERAAALVRVRLLAAPPEAGRDEA